MKRLGSCFLSQLLRQSPQSVWRSWMVVGGRPKKELDRAVESVENEEDEIRHQTIRIQSGIYSLYEESIKMHTYLSINAFSHFSL